MTYLENIQAAMSLIAKHKNSVFLGQSVAVPGNLLFQSLKKIPQKQKIELPVFEDAQLGISLGMALNNSLPVSCYPRFDFFLLAFNQLVNHIDKINQISSKNFNPFLIMRVLVGAKKPVDAGPQHTQNFIKPVKLMCKNIKIVNLNDKKKIIKSYKDCLKSKKTTLFVEYSDKYYL